MNRICIKIRSFFILLFFKRYILHFSFLSSGLVQDLCTSHHWWYSIEISRLIYTYLRRPKSCVGFKVVGNHRKLRRVIGVTNMA